MKIILVGISVLISMAYCRSGPGKKTTMYIHNGTVFTIDSIKIATFGGGCVTGKLKSNDRTECTFIVNHPSNYEDTFIATIYVKGIIKNARGFGYYEGESDIHSEYHIEIADTFSIVSAK